MDLYVQANVLDSADRREELKRLRNDWMQTMYKLRQSDDYLAPPTKAPAEADTPPIEDMRATAEPKYTAVPEEAPTLPPLPEYDERPELEQMIDCRACIIINDASGRKQLAGGVWSRTEESFANVSDGTWDVWMICESGYEDMLDKSAILSATSPAGEVYEKDISTLANADQGGILAIPQAGKLLRSIYLQNGWEHGKYTLEIILNDTIAARTEFTIIGNDFSSQVRVNAVRAGTYSSLEDIPIQPASIEEKGYIMELILTEPIFISGDIWPWYQVDVAGQVRYISAQDV